MKNIGFAFERPGIAPSLYLRVGPITIMRWPRDRARWFIRRGVAYLLAGSLGKYEILFWHLASPRRKPGTRPRGLPA